jgi:hypothetical protein
MVGAILRQELELKMIGGGRSLVGCDGVWVSVGRVEVLVGAEVGWVAERSVAVEVEVETLESERESVVSDSEDLDGDGDGGEERWRGTLVA